MNNELKRIGSLIRELREIEGCNQMELAQRAGIRQATISDVENGNSNVEFKTLTAISDALNCDIHLSLTVRASGKP